MGNERLRSLKVAHDRHTDTIQYIGRFLPFLLHRYKELMAAAVAAFAGGLQQQAAAAASGGATSGGGGSGGGEGGGLAAALARRDPRRRFAERVMAEVAAASAAGADGEGDGGSEAGTQGGSLVGAPCPGGACANCKLARPVHERQGGDAPGTLLLAVLTVYACTYQSVCTRYVKLRRGLAWQPSPSHATAQFYFGRACTSKTVTSLVSTSTGQCVAGAPLMRSHMHPIVIRTGASCYARRKAQRCTPQRSQQEHHKHDKAAAVEATNTAAAWQLNCVIHREAWPTLMTNTHQPIRYRSLTNLSHPK